MKRSPRRTARARSSTVKREPGQSARPRTVLRLTAARRGGARAALPRSDDAADATGGQKVTSAARRAETASLGLEFRGMFYRRLSDRPPNDYAGSLNLSCRGLPRDYARSI